MTREYITTTEYIFGTNLVSLQVKKIRISSPEAAVTRVVIPPEIKEIYMDITISIDIIFVNKVEFVMVISNNLKFITPGYISIRRQ